MRLLFAVLLFVVSCGGGSGSEGDAGNPTSINPGEIPTILGGTPSVPVATDDPCSSPLLTRSAPLPRGSHPSWFVNGINATPPLADGFVIRLRSDGTMYGNFGRSEDVSAFVLVHDACGVGTRAPAYAGHWVYTSNNCFCQRYDILPSAVLCLSFLDPESQTACSHHNVTPSEAGQATASSQGSNDVPPDWYDIDMEGGIERLPEIPNEISEILTELE